MNADWFKQHMKAMERKRHKKDDMTRVECPNCDEPIVGEFPEDEWAECSACGWHELDDKEAK